MLFDLAQDVLLLLLGARSSAALMAEKIFLRKLILYPECEVKP
jgi:hypothetical protein